MAIEYNPLKFKIHWTHKAKIKKLYKEGFTVQELAIMYKVHWSRITPIVKGLERQERI